MATHVPRQRLVTVPNLVTLMRPIYTLPFVLLCTRIQRPAAVWPRVGVVLLFAIITGSDVLDGWLARRLSQESPLGRALDHGCDVLFVLTALGFFVSCGLAPWWLPTAIAWAFTLYSVASWWRTAGQAQRVLLGSRVGHFGGILYYATVGVVTGNLCLGSRILPAGIVHGWFLGVALLALISGLEHLMLLARALRHRSPARLTAGSLHRSAHSEP